MVLRLGEALQVPLRERNQLLHAAGLPAAYPEAGMDSADLAPFRAALDTLLTAHCRIRRWCSTATGPSLWPMLPASGYGGDVVGENMVRRFVSDPAGRQAIVNWPEVAWAGLDRLRRQHDLAPFDENLGELVALAEAALADVSRPDGPSPDLVLCPWFRVGSHVIKTIGVAARFDATAEVTLDELRIELSYPLDDASDRFFRQSG